MTRKKKTEKISSKELTEDASQETLENLEEKMGFISSEESNEQLSRMIAAAQQAEEKIIDEMAEQSQKARQLQDRQAQAELARQVAEDEALQKIEAEAATLANSDQDELDEELKAALPTADEQGNPDLESMQSCIEALLFMSEKPLPLKKLKEYLGPQYSQKLFKEAMSALEKRYADPHQGIELKEVAGGYQLRTKPERAALARLLSKTQPHKLSRGAMETLAIVAYKQPILKDEVDKIRGVDSSHFIRGLMDKKLIHMNGRSELPGRPILYGTTTEFLEIFGLKDLSALPPLRELESMVPSSEADADGDDSNEDPQLRQLRQLVHHMNEDKHRLEYNPKEDDQILDDFRQQVKSIPISTPFLEKQKEEEKAAREAKHNPQASLLEGAEIASPETEDNKSSETDSADHQDENAQPPSSEAASAKASPAAEEPPPAANESENPSEKAPLKASHSEALQKAAELVRSGAEE